MKTILRGKRWLLWIDRNPAAWFELWAQWDYHDYLLSVTMLTFEIGFDRAWTKARPTLKKGGRQIIWRRQ
jgi:hypothetical protein